MHMVYFTIQEPTFPENTLCLYKTFVQYFSNTPHMTNKTKYELGWGSRGRHAASVLVPTEINHSQ